ncbi:hypothetical protein OC844_003793 [Tilletia horrida]|nr:hypothetical protein OC844_003793 [Tilletia horrida]
MKGSKIDTTGLPHHRILGQILYELICRESSGDGVRIAALRRELAADEVVARAYPHNLSKAISNSLRRLLWDGKIIREARGFYQVAPVSANQSPTASTSANPVASTSAAGAAASSSSQPNKNKNKHKSVTRHSDDDDDDLDNSDDDSGPRKKPKLSASAFNGLQLPPLGPPSHHHHHHHHHYSLPLSYPDHRHPGPPPMHHQYPTYHHPGPNQYHYHLPAIESYPSSRSGFGTSWERNPPAPRFYAHAGGSLPDAHILPPINPAPVATGGATAAAAAPPPPPPHPESSRSSTYPSAQDIAYEISSFLPDMPANRQYSSHNVPGRTTMPSPSRSPPFYPYGPYTTSSTAHPHRPYYTTLPMSSSRGDSASYGSGSGSGSGAGSRDTLVGSSLGPGSSSGSSLEPSKPLSIANLLSRPVSPTDNVRQNFAKRCPSLAKLVVEALQVLASSSEAAAAAPPSTAVSTSMVRSWVHDRLPTGNSAVEVEQRDNIGRAVDMMLSSLSCTGVAVESGTDASGEKMYALVAAASTS